MTFPDEAQALFDRMVTAYRAGDAGGCAACFTEDAVLLSPYAPETTGRAAVEALHRDWTAPGGAKTLTVIEAESAGDLGWCLVAYSEGDGSDGGKSLNVLRRQKDGSWLISHCSLASDDPPLLGA
ncbi:DUF4440 domain-containing protein [Defluviimonas sp. D31]|uniref:YybH family protein n=1 Tax=Defluviimonas sp. D31 TaxID=3083253 RepID=UPI00296FD76C|nr:DUF4440 domain-containing protein [Defluviimonas sp. D31]MDW4548290.1 DUF4440 domain-containing protein [Defluviimonas sp. D31]